MIDRMVRIYFFIFLFLVLFGMVMVFNIRIFNVSVPESAVTKLLTGEIVKFLFASLAFLIALTADLRFVRDILPYILLFTILLLLATFIGGSSVKGARRWINLGFMMLQPSEFAKITVVLYLASTISRKGDSLAKDVIYPFIVVAAISLFIAVEDLGTGVIIAAISIMLLLMAGMTFRFFGLIAVLSVLLGTTLFLLPGKGYRKARIEAYLHPEQHPDMVYQQTAARIAMGSGGMFGVGFGNSERKQRFLPEAHTDFILGVIGEEFGFIGVFALVACYLLLLILGVFFALFSHDMLHVYIIAGFTLMIALQSAINMGVVLRLLPNKGVPLPFISHGGSALMSYAMMVGFILNAVLSEQRNSTGP